MQRKKQYSHMSPIKYKTTRRSGTESYNITRKCCMLSVYFGTWCLSTKPTYPFLKIELTL